MPDEATARNNLESYYKNVLGEMTTLYKNGTFAGNTEQLASFLYIAHLGGLRLMDLYMLSVHTDCGEATVQNAQAELAGVKEYIRNKARGGTLVNTENIYKFAAEMNENLIAVCNTQETNPMKDGMKKGWSLMVSCLAETAEKMADIERVTHHNILVQLPSSEQSFRLGETKNTNVSLYNYTDAEITGTVQVLDPANGLAGVSEEVSVAPGLSMCVPVPVLFDKEFGPGEMLKLRFVENGGVQKTKEAPFTLDITGSGGTGFTTYTADEVDAAAERHAYQWMYSLDDEKYYAMDSAREQTYKTSTIDKNRYIACQVTPIYADGSKGTPKLQKKGVITSLKTVPCASIPAEERAKTKTTPPEYKFRLKGSNREYVLLDVFSGETESKYYVLSDFLTANLEQHNIDPQNINPADKDSIGYWLNTTYVNQGYSLASVAWPKLEQDLYRYIDKNHTWYVEAGITNQNNGQKRGYAYTAGIGLLTETEALKYLGRYGWNITTENGDWYNPWLLATGNADTNQYIVVMNFKVDNNVKHSGEHTIFNATPGSGHQEMYARPAFYLNDNFFKSVRLDVDTMGAHVKEIILENYTKNEMAGIYSESELESIGYDANPVGIKNFTNADGEARAKIEIPDEACMLVVAVYDADDECIGVKIMDNSKNTISFEQEAKRIKAFYWSNLGEMKPVYPAAMQEKTADWQ